MSETDNGGPAFPDPGRAQSAKQREVLTSTGMTLRDYFAAKVVSAIWTNNELLHCMPDGQEGEAIAKLSYEQADAMLKERAK